jgi:hypothetical protein
MLSKVPAEAIKLSDVKSEIQWVENVEQEAVSHFDDSDAEFYQWWNTKLAEASSSMPMATYLLPDMDRLRSEAQTAEIENAMLAAGIALEEGNRAAFQSIVNPATGQHFFIGTGATLGPGAFNTWEAARSSRQGFELSSSANFPAPSLQFAPVKPVPQQ